MTTQRQEKKAQVNRERAAHHAALAALYKATTGKECDGLNLWRKLARIEREAHAGATAYCNGESVLAKTGKDFAECFNFCADETAWERFADYIGAKVAKVFGGKLPAGFFVNGDARGYALKLEPEDSGKQDSGFHRDWGSNYILAPTID